MFMKTVGRFAWTRNPRNLIGQQPWKAALQQSQRQFSNFVGLFSTICFMTCCMRSYLIWWYRLFSSLEAGYNWLDCRKHSIEQSEQQIHGHCGQEDACVELWTAMCSKMKWLLRLHQMLLSKLFLGARTWWSHCCLLVNCLQMIVNELLLFAFHLQTEAWQRNRAIG